MIKIPDIKYFEHLTSSILALITILLIQWSILNRLLNTRMTDKYNSAIFIASINIPILIVAYFYSFFGILGFIFIGVFLMIDIYVLFSYFKQKHN